MPDAISHPADRVKKLIAAMPVTAFGREPWIAEALQVLLIGEVERLYAKYPLER